MFGYVIAAISDKWWGQAIALFAWLIFPAFVGGYITATISTRQDIIHVAITALVFLLIFLISMGFRFDKIDKESWSFLALIIFFTFLGGIVKIGIKKKRKFVSDN